jgi:hypothetical protein
MGQYWVAVCLDRNQKVKPHDYGAGAKLMEHSWIHAEFIRSVLGLLMKGNPWYKKQIAWVGDYSDDDPMLTQHCNECINDKKNINCPDFVKAIVGECDGTYQQYYRGAKTIKPKAPSIKKLPLHHYMVNHTKMEFVDTKKCKVEEESKEYNMKWIIYPLSLLTATSNGRGGGDYHGKNNDSVGYWLGDKISVELEEPKGFEELVPDFTEVHYENKIEF